MADPTQALRDRVLSVIPGAAGASIDAERRAREEQLAVDEANNLVMQRNAPNLPSEALNVINPDIPVTADKPPAPQVSPIVQAGPAPASVDTALNYSVPDRSDALLSTLDSHQAAAEKRFNKQEEERSNRIGEINVKLSEIEKQPFSFDNRSLWEKSSTGSKIALLIGGFLSSLSPQSAQSFQNGVKTTIENDLAIQKQKLDDQKDNKNSLLGQLNRELGNKEAAGAAWEAMVYKGIADKLGFQAQNAQSKAMKEQAAFARDMAIKEYQFKKEVAISKSSESGSTTKLGAEEKKRFDAAKESLDAVRSMRDLLFKNGKRTSQNTFSPMGDNSYTLLQDQFAEQYGRMQSGGVVGDDERKAFKNKTPKPIDSKEIQLTKLNRLEKELQDRLRTLGVNEEVVNGAPTYVTRK